MYTSICRIIINRGIEIRERNISRYFFLRYLTLWSQEKRTSSFSPTKIHRYDPISGKSHRVKIEDRENEEMRERELEIA